MAAAVAGLAAAGSVGACAGPVDDTASTTAAVPDRTETARPFGAIETPKPDPPSAAAVDVAAALERLAALEAVGPVWEGYDRDLFEHWTLDGASGCDTRRLVLIAQAVQTPDVAAGCRLTAGAWVSPYDQRRFTGTGAGIEIDHLVPLAEAWRSGAWAWPLELRRAFANDLAGLVAVSAESNQAKLASGPEEWLPPDAAAHCWYATSWIAVKHRWSLNVDVAERDALTAILTDCSPAAPAPQAPPEAGP